MVPWWVNNSPNIQELLLQPSQAYVNYPGTAFFVFHECLPWGNSIIFQGKRAPDQFETKIKRNIVPIKGTQGPYSSPI